MNAVKKTLYAFGVLVSTSAVTMAESIDVKVIGTITPTACSAKLDGGATIDYGNIHPESLKEDTVSILDEKQVSFSITCNAPAKLAIHAVGSRSDTATDSTPSSSGYSYFNQGELFGKKNVNVTGLGLSNSGKKIGGYGIRLVPDSYTLDSKKAETIVRKSPADSWTLSSNHDNGSLFASSTKDLQISWSEAGKLEPIAFKSLAGKLGVQAYITKTSELNLTEAVKLNGLTVLELVYL